MSQTLELPDEVHAALRQAAEAEGVTPADWISARLSTDARDENAPADTTAPRTLADLFTGRVGRISSVGRGGLSEEAGRKFADHLEEKQRAGHL